MKLLCKLGIHKFKKLFDGKGCCTKCGTEGCKFEKKPHTIAKLWGPSLLLEGTCKRCKIVIYKVLK